MKNTDGPNVSLVVPAYNEEKCLPGFLDSVLPALNAWIISEIIIINDGSEDSTLDIAKTFASNRPQVQVIHIARNSGKGNALAEGVLLASGEIILFLDADLVNVTTKDIEAIIGPLLEGTAQACIATIKSKATPWNTLSGVSGQRAYFRSDLLPFIERFRPLGYGIEAFLGKELSHLQTTKVSLTTISYISKGEKRGHIRGTLEHAKMWPEVFAGALKKKGADADTQEELAGKP